MTHYRVKRSAFTRLIADSPATLITLLENTEDVELGDVLGFIVDSIEAESHACTRELALWARARWGPPAVPTLRVAPSAGVAIVPAVPTPVAAADTVAPRTPPLPPTTTTTTSTSATAPAPKWRRVAHSPADFAELGAYLRRNYECADPADAGGVTAAGMLHRYEVLRLSAGSVHPWTEDEIAQAARREFNLAGAADDSGVLRLRCR